IWFNGPAWLTDEGKWPQNVAEVNNDLVAQECRSHEVTMHAVHNHVEPIIDLDRFSKLNHAIATRAYVQRFVQRLRKVQNISDNVTLSPEERERAMVNLILESQMNLFQTELKAVAENKSIDKRSTLRNFPLLLDQSGILRIKSRLSQGNYDYNERFPIVLSSKHRLSQLIVHDVHQKIGHVGVSAVLSEIRSTYWMINARTLIKSILHKCVVCKKHQGTNADECIAPLP